MTSSIGCSVEGTGTPLVLLHSSMSSRMQWNRLIDQLKSDYQTIAIDLIGYGETAFPSNSATFSLRDEVELVLSVINEKIGAATPFHLIGHSYGGAIGLRLAYEQKARIVSLAIYEPVAFYLLDKQEAAYHEICAVVDGIEKTAGEDAEAATRLFIDYWNGSGAFDALRENIRKGLTAQIKKVQLDFQALIGEPLTLGDLRCLDMPTCLISGRQSPASTRRIVDLLSATLPNLIRHEVEGGHMAPITHADAVNRLFAAFVANQQDSK